MADEKTDREVRERLDTLRLQLRQAARPTDFIELALASPLVECVKVSKLRPGEIIAGPFVAEFTAPEPAPEDRLLQVHGEGVYSFAAYAARGQGITGGIVGRKQWPIPDGYRVSPEEMEAARSGKNIVNDTDLAKAMSATITEVGRAETFRRVMGQERSPDAAASSLTMVKEIAQIMKPASDGGNGALWLKMLEFIAEQNRTQLAMMQKQIEALAGDDKDDKAGGLGTVKETVEFVRDVAGALGWDVGGGGKHESGIWDALPTIAEKVAEPLVALGNRALDLRAAELHARTGQPPVVTEIPKPALAPEGGAPVMTKPTAMTEDPRWKDIRETLVAELSKPADDLDVEGIASWLRTIPTGPDETLYDKCADLAETREHLARLSIKLVDARLASDQLWPAVKQVLAHIKEQEEEAERDEKKETT